MVCTMSLSRKKKKKYRALIEITASTMIFFIYKEKRLRDAHARLKKRGVPLAANQVNYSLIYRTPELNGVKAACDELGITLIAYSPIAQGKEPASLLIHLPNHAIVLNLTVLI